MLVLGTLMIPDQLRLVPIYLMLVNWIPPGSGTSVGTMRPLSTATV